MTIRRREVAVAVVFDPASQSFLLCHNSRWHGYAFPMKHLEPDGAETNGDAALQALDEWRVSLDVAHAKASALDHLVECLFSEATRQYTLYDYHVFEIELGAPVGPALHPDLRWFTYQQLQDAVNVTSSTKEIVLSFVEDRRVAVGVLTRPGGSGREYLVVRNPNYGYFFPSTRIKTAAHPAEAMIEAVRLDLGYEDDLDVVAQGDEVPALEESKRFGIGQRRFHYHLGVLETPGMDLATPGNSLEQAVAKLTAQSAPPLERYTRWLNEDELQSGAELSPSMSVVLPAVVQLVEQHYRT